MDDPNVHFSYVRVFFTNIFMMPRFILGWSLFFAGPLLAVVLSIGEGKLNGKLPDWKLRILKRVLTFGLHCAMIACGMVSMRKK